MSGSIGQSVRALPTMAALVAGCGLCESSHFDERGFQLTVQADDGGRLASGPYRIVLALDLEPEATCELTVENDWLDVGGCQQAPGSSYLVLFRNVDDAAWFRIDVVGRGRGSKRGPELLSIRFEREDAVLAEESFVPDYRDVCGTEAVAEETIVVTQPR